MRLDRVTITGADDSIRPQDLLPLTKDFPWVEWGILASAKNSIGGPRFPTLGWMCQFREMVIAEGIKPSLHLCGRWTRQLLIGEIDPTVLQLVSGYARVQLNFHAERSKCEPDRAMKALCRIRECSKYGDDLEFIFQMDGATGNEHMEDIASHYVNAYGDPSNFFGLFDVSGGAGVLPKQWPEPMYHADGVYDYHGYAGGLGPDNLDEQLPLIGKAAGECRIWIDMETKVRSDDDSKFNLAKVRRCLETCSPFICERSC